MPISINKCNEYDFQAVKQTLENQFSRLFNIRHFFEGKNVVIKPNLLMKANPDKCITTHPIVLEAVIEIIKANNPQCITLAESPGGPYNHTSLGIIYKASEIAEVCERQGITLNYDTSAEHISNPAGEVCKVFNIITPIKNAEVIVNLCKLKTHSLTTMSASIKNL